jgi:hypothetical protein
MSTFLRGKVITGNQYVYEVEFTGITFYSCVFLKGRINSKNKEKGYDPRDSHG